MYCSNCGKKVPIEAQYCPDCGEVIFKPNQQPSAFGLSKDDLSLFVGSKNTDFYLDKWEKQTNPMSQPSWNWAAFFLGPFWLGYRKIFLPIVFLSGLLAFFYLITFAFQINSFAFGLLSVPLFATFWGLSGNAIYFRHAKRKIERIKLRHNNSDLEIARAGHSGWSGVFVSIVLVGLYITLLITVPYPNVFYNESSNVVAPNTNLSFIDTVRSGSFDEYPDQSVGMAFENYFMSPQWDYFRSDDNEDVVEFIGLTNDGEVNIQFIVSYESLVFEIGYFAIDGVPQDDDILFKLLDKIFIAKENSLSL